MLVKLTRRGKPTIFNASHIVTMYMDTDLKNGEFKTKIITTNGIVFVDEPLNVVHEELNKALGGEFPLEYDYEVPSIDDRMENKYNSQIPPMDRRPQRGYHTERYSRY
jgi:hypothetical protein